MWYSRLCIIFIIQLLYKQVDGLEYFSLHNGYKVLHLALTSTLTPTSTLKVQTRWMEQPLDHFDSSENRIWMMRYFENLQLWKAKGPIIIFIGGEGEADPRFLTGGLIYELANETNGALFMSEHRYYGKSKPLKYNGVESLQFLSSRQALADLARMIERLKLLPVFKNSKVILVGGSYPGNLAAWMKLLYPDLVDAALASSAPVLAKKNFYEYLETVSDVYEQIGPPGCHDAVTRIFKRYEELLSSKSGILQLKKELNICKNSDLNRDENKQLFIYAMTGYYMVNAQYGSVSKVNKHCNELMNTSSVRANNQLSGWFNDLKPISFWDEEEDCNSIDFDEIIDEIKNNEWWTSWVYQMCSEFSYAKSTSSDNQPFTKYIPITTFYKICTLAFGDKFNELSIEKAVNATNKLYGGLKPKVKHVVFVNGDMDPWHRLGVLEDISYEAVAKVIPRSSHCVDLLPSRKGDSEELKETRAYIKYMIKHWIGIEPCDLKESPDCLKYKIETRKINKSKLK